MCYMQTVLCLVPTLFLLGICQKNAGERLQNCTSQPKWSTCSIGLAEVPLPNMKKTDGGIKRDVPEDMSLVQSGKKRLRVIGNGKTVRTI